MTVKDLKELEDKGMFAQGYRLYAYDPDSEKYEPITGVLVSKDGLVVKVQTDD